MNSKKEANEIPEIDREIFEEIAQDARLDVKEEEDNDDIIFVWDFGGQAEYYATHDLFVRADVVHLIVMDITKDFTKIVDDSTHDIQSVPTFCLNSRSTSVLQAQLN